MSLHCLGAWQRCVGEKLYIKNDEEQRGKKERCQHSLDYLHRGAVLEWAGTCGGFLAAYLCCLIEVLRSLLI
jgi:hypothetical protein